MADPLPPLLVVTLKLHGAEDFINAAVLSTPNYPRAVDNLVALFTQD